MTIRDILEKENIQTFHYVEERMLLDPQVFGKDSIFSGVFAIHEGEIVSLDGDSYSFDSEVAKYQIWTANKSTESFKEGDTCMTVYYTKDMTR